MNLRQIRYLVRAIEVGNITRAAEQLHVAQPALGLQIRQLEEELGVALILRHSRGVSPTQAGQAFYERSLEALRILDEAKREASALGDQRQEAVSLGLTPGLITLLGGGLLFSVQAELPELQLSLVEEMSHILVDAIQRQEIDLALAYEARERPALLRTPLLEEELLLITSQPAAAPHPEPVTLEDVLRRPLVLTGERDPVRQQLANLADQHGLMLKPAFEASSVAAIKTVVASGAACGIMAYGSAAREIRQGQLSFRRIRDCPLRRTLYLVQSAHRAPLRQESALRSFLARALQQAVVELGDLVRLLPDLEGTAGTPVLPPPSRDTGTLSSGTKLDRAPIHDRLKPVPDDLWAALQPLLPAEGPKSRGGRPRISDRAALAGILFMLRTGRPWHAVPVEFGCCGKTSRRRLREWQATGNWGRIHQILRQRLPDADALHWRLVPSPEAPPPPSLSSAVVGQMRRTPSYRKPARKAPGGKADAPI
jgi:LysR family nitrogen assimilation transcriptional regulator